MPVSALACVSKILSYSTQWGVSGKFLVIQMCLVVHQDVRGDHALAGSAESDNSGVQGWSPLQARRFGVLAVAILIVDLLLKSGRDFNVQRVKALKTELSDRAHFLI